MEMNQFEQQVIASAQMEQHAKEIKESRIGGLGGSDAAILMKIGEKGLAALSNTDNKRIAVMLGMTEQSDWSNAYTNAGHAFEDYSEKVLPLGRRYTRELKMEQALARNFKTFAHADFVFEGDNVIECKFVQETTAATITKYYAQLQWYYAIGAESVRLFHGVGTAEPFEVTDTELVEIERDETAIKILIAGVKTLDEALADGWKPTHIEKMSLEETPEMVQAAFKQLIEVKAQQAELDEKKAEAVKVIKEYIEDWELNGIFLKGDVNHSVTYSKPSSKMQFDAAKFLAEHPEFDRPEWYKKSNVKSSITFK